jgi:hypothetical protein
MKKKILAVLVIMVVAITTLLTTTACATGIFKVNEDRDYHQVIATVNYKDLSKEIYKGELENYVSAYASYYSYYYSMSTEDTMKYFYNSLTRNALMGMYAKYDLYNNPDNEAYKGNSIDNSKSITEFSSKDFVSLQQYVYAIDQVNSQFLSSFNSLLEEEEEEEESTGKEVEKTDDLPEARTVRTYDDEDADSYDASSKVSCIAIYYGEKYVDLTYGEVTEEFIKNTLGESSVDTFLQKMEAYNIIQKKIDAEKDNTEKKAMKTALKTLKENMSDSYVTYQDTLDDQVTSVVLSNFQTKVEKTVSSTDDEIKAVYDKLIYGDKANADKDTYATALEDTDTTIYVNAVDTYAGVKSILLQFSDAQSSALTAITAMYGNNETKINELRDKMALGIADDTIDTMLKDNKGVTSNISNTQYDSTNDLLSQAYTDKDVSYVVVLYAMAEDMKNVPSQIVAKFEESDEYKAMDATKQATAKAIVEYNAKVEVFTQWMYKVNDDSGMFSSDSYLITPDGEDTSYVEEYTVLARKLAQQSIASYTIDGYSNGSIIKDESVDFTGNSISAKGKYKIYSQEYTSTTTSPTETLKAYIYTLETESGATISFIINTYGIHVVFVSNQYGKDAFVSDGVETKTIDEKNAIVYTLSHIYDQNCTIKYDNKYTAVAEGATPDLNTKYYVWNAGEFELAKIDTFEEVKSSDTFDSTKVYYILNSDKNYERVDDLTAFAEGTTYYTKVRTFKTGVTYYTASWELVSVSCDYMTLKEYLDDERIDQKYQDEYSKEQVELFVDDIDVDSGKYIKKNTKVYDKLLEDLTSSTTNS